MTNKNVRQPSLGEMAEALEAKAKELRQAQQSVESSEHRLKADTNHATLVRKQLHELKREMSERVERIAMPVDEDSETQEG